MSNTNSLAERARKGLQKAIEGIPGTLGRLESTGSLTVPVSGVTNGVYVKLYDDPLNLVVAIDLKTSRKPGLGVRVRENTSGVYEVVDLDTTVATIFLGDAAPAANYPPAQGSSLNLLLESYQFKPGKIRALSTTGLQVHMEDLPYGDSLLGGNGDLTTIVGTITSGKKAFIVISNNPNTNTLEFTKSTEYGLPVALTRSIADQTVIPTGNTKLASYLMRSGATYIPVQPQSPDTIYFVDHRPWLQPPPSIATLQTTDDTQTTIASIAVAELQAVTVTATFTAAKDDYSAAIGGTLVAVVRRASGGDVTLVDSVTTVAHEDSSGTPVFILDVDTGTETARLRCTGITAETWNWRVRYEVVVS